MAERSVSPATGAESFSGDNPIAVAPGVTLRRWWTTDKYYGSADALIAYGIITAEQLPAKSATTFYDGEPRSRWHSVGVRRDERYMHILRTGKKYCVSVGLPKVEQERRRQADDERMRRQQEEQKAARNSALYSDPEQMLFEARINVRALYNLLADHTPGEHERGKPRFALRFSADGIAGILESLQEIREWVDAATIYPAASKANPEAPKALQAAKADPGFQAFLQSQCLKD